MCGVEREAGSFDVVSELALSAAGPRVPRGHVPPGHEAAHETQGSPISHFLFLFIWVFVCVCVCEASSGKVELV